MTIPEKICYYAGKHYDMDYNIIHGVLRIKEKIRVVEFLIIKEIIGRLNLWVTNIIVES